MGALIFGRILASEMGDDLLLTLEGCLPYFSVESILECSGRSLTESVTE
jgi:hypothetical protein